MTETEFDPSRLKCRKAVRHFIHTQVSVQSNFRDRSDKV